WVTKPRVSTYARRSHAIGEGPSVGAWSPDHAPRGAFGRPRGVERSGDRSTTRPPLLGRGLGPRPGGAEGWVPQRGRGGTVRRPFQNELARAFARLGVASTLTEVAVNTDGWATRLPGRGRSVLSPW